MAILKCKMCGGDLHFEQGASICECEYCGNTNTLPVVDTDQEMNLFNRANHFRMINEFDRAISAYEKILDSDDTNAEAHWGIVLSRYGIEYVEDPVSHKRIPTCHRVQMTSILSDPDYLAAIEHADSIASTEYKAQAEEIARIQKGILTISSKEKPYDVFICYKESEENGRRTIDSTLAQDIYYGLTESGYRVFFSRITLEDKLGQEYEPYIFAALNSAKVMLVIGTKPEYFNAVWVKNEWSRYLDLMKNDRHRLLIPCYRDMDPYDLPDELSMLQSQDMAKIGFMQDLLRGIKKVLKLDSGKSSIQEKSETQNSNYGNTEKALLKRGYIALEDNEWDKADGFFEETLNLNPECSEAYIGKLLAKEKKTSFASWLEMQKEKYSSYTSEQRLEACPADIAHISEKTKEYSLEGYLSEDRIRMEYEFERRYNSALSCRIRQKEKQLSELSSERLLTRAQQYAKGSTKGKLENALNELVSLLDTRIVTAQEDDEHSIEQIKAAYAEHIASADKIVEELSADAYTRREQCYQSAVNLMEKADVVSAYEKAREALKELNGYKNSNDLVDMCQKKIDRLNAEKKQQAEKKRKHILAAVLTGITTCLAVVVLTITVIIPRYRKNLLSKAEIGDTVYFGTYEQDNNTLNGRENIEWIVLDKKGDQILLISKYILDCQSYNTSFANVTWETCSLRTWLNDSFINTAFSSEESGRIMTTVITAEEGSDSVENVSKQTQDKIFLLGETEMHDYFNSYSERQCTPTEYAVSQGVYADKSSGNGFWWLLNSDREDTYAPYVIATGSISSKGRPVDSQLCGIRPVLWINQKE